jgi:hypothetical protein
MFCYSAFALIIHSELELPELPPGNGEADISIRFGKTPAVRRSATIREEFASTEKVGDFVISEGNEILVYPRAGVSVELLRVVLLGKVMAFLLRQRGLLPLHASAVVLGGGGVLFLGFSGAGKSTTAAAFHCRGHLVIADDVGAVGTADGCCLVRPTWSRLRLTEDSRAFFPEPIQTAPAEFQVDKHSVDLGREKLPKQFPVKRIYVLEDGDSLEILTVPRAMSALLLETHSFIKRWRVERDVLEFHFRRCAAIADLMPVHRLRRPRSFEVLDHLVDLVERDVNADE